MGSLLFGGGDWFSSIIMKEWERLKMSLFVNSRKSSLYFCKRSKYSISMDLSILEMGSILGHSSGGSDGREGVVVGSGCWECGEEDGGGAVGVDRG